MRIEMMSHKEKIRALNRLHKRLNREFFDGKLNSKILIDIGMLGEFNDSDVLGSFSHAAYAYSEKTGEVYRTESITISRELINELRESKTQRSQLLCIATIMLHEMIHQYCYENGLPLDHGREFCKAAEEHGLISIYEEERKIDEYLTEKASMIVSMYRTL